jgi:hypothetical protein
MVTPATVTPGGHRRFAAADIASRAAGSNGDTVHANSDGVGHAST